MDRGDKTGNLADLIDAYVARDEKCARDDEGRLRAIDEPSGCPFEVFQCLPVGDSCQRPVQFLIEGFEVELDAATGACRVADGHVEEFGIHHSVRLPADPNATFLEHLCGRECVRNLGGWVSAEETDAKCVGVRVRSKLGGAEGFAPPRGSLAKVPVLAKEAIGRAAFVEDGQIVIARLSMAFAHPIGHAVRRQRVTVPLQETSPGYPGQVDDFALTHDTEPAKTALPFPDDTQVSTQRTRDAPGIARGSHR